MYCKHVQENQKQNKCHDYYMSHNEHHPGIHCRLKEWKRKRGICPYDKSILSRCYYFKKKKNKKLEDFDNAKISSFCK